MSIAKKDSKKSEVVKVVQADGVDEIMFDTVSHATKIQQLSETPEGEGLTQDAFTSFFTHEPKTIENGEPVQKGVVDVFMGLDEFKNLRTSTKNDEVGSALAAVQFVPELIKQYQEMKKKMKEKQEQAKKDGKPAPQTLGEALNNKEAAGLRQAMRRGLEKAQDKADDWSDMCAAWGVDKGELQQVLFEKRFQLAEQMTKSGKLKKISELAGRFKNVVHSAAATSPCHGMDEIVDITIGNDIGRMLPSEIVKLIEHPEQFYADFLEKKLLVYNMKGKQDLGKGPIIACLDISGSMNEDGKEEWAKAVILALMALAEKQNRSFGFIAFNDRVESKKYWPKQMSIPLQDKVKVAEIASTGGTNFYNPLIESFNFRKKEPTLKPADIIFITDGECQLYPEQVTEIQDLKKATDVRVYGIGISGSYGPISGEVMKQFCDQTVIVNNLGEIDTIKDLMVSTAQSQMGSGKAKS